MATRSSCHLPSSSSSSSMATSQRIGIRKATLRFITSAHGCSSSSSQGRQRIAATTNKKVFEDQLRGIVCYKDDKGELVCEGYDEGPRLGMRLPEKACFPWPVGVQITDFVELATLRVFEDADVLQLKNDQKRQI